MPADSEGPSAGMIVGLIILGMVLVLGIIGAYLAIRHFFPAVP